MEQRLTRLMSTSSRNGSVGKWRHCTSLCSVRRSPPLHRSTQFLGLPPEFYGQFGIFYVPKDFKYCASYSFAFRQLPEQCNLRSGFPQHCRSCMPGCQCALDDCTSQLRPRRQYLSTSPTLSWPGHFHTYEVYLIPHTSQFQPLTLQAALSGPGTNTAWYVACGTPFLSQAESCYQTLGSVLRMSFCSCGGRSPRLRPPSQNVIAQTLCHILSRSHNNSPKQRSGHELGRKTMPCC